MTPRQPTRCQALNISHTHTHQGSRREKEKVLSRMRYAFCSLNGKRGTQRYRRSRYLYKDATVITLAMFSTVVLGGSHQIPLRELCRHECLCANARRMNTIVPDALEKRPFILTAEKTLFSWYQTRQDAVGYRRLRVLPQSWRQIFSYPWAFSISL